MELDRRRGTGESGRKVLVLANAFKVNKLPDFNIMHYDVAIDPECPARVNRQIYAEMKKTGLFGDIAAVYDGQKNLYAPKPLPFQGTTATASIFLPDGDRPPRPGQEPRGRTFKVSIRLVAQVNLHELAVFIGGGQSASSNVLMAINALNVMIRNEPSLEYPSKKASFYPPPKQGETPYMIQGGLEMWGGYFTSIRPTPGKLIVNMDRTAMAFIQAGDLVTVAVKFMRVQDPSQLARSMDRQRIQLERFVKGLQIVTRSLESGDGKKTRRKKYKIRALSKMPASQLQFEGDNGEQWTIQTYFQKMYNYTLRFPTLPCVQVTKKAWYPMEVCEVERGNKFTKKLSPEQVADALKFTTQPPNARLQLIRTGLQYLNLGRNETLRAWQFGLEQSPLQVKARVLEPPVLAYADQRGQGESIANPRDGGWDIRGKRSTAAGKVERWVVIVFANEQGSGPRDPGFPMQAAQQSVTNFVGACSQFGIQFANRQPVIHYAGDNMDVRGAFIKASQAANLTPQNPPQFILTYVPMKNSRQYPLIKATGDVGLGVATQNLVIQKARNAKPQYYQNVALKVNVKLAGINQVVKNGILSTLNQKPTIIFGADVGHPGPGSQNPSIASLVGSFDLQGIQYATAVRVQNSREEIIMDLEEMTIGLLRKFFKSTRRKPERIIFYRDGVSEGQYAEVCRREITAIKKACGQIEASFAPPITYIVCGKRHHIRFFPATSDGGDRSGNVRAGTVIDLDIVHPTDNDFYLMSHGGLLGTSRPCHYAVLRDESRLSADAIQQLTYHLAYIYPRSTRSVSIVSPAYYAHHVATRARAHLGNDDDDSSTVISSASSNREAEMRDEKLRSARSRLRQIHANLENTMYFM